MSTNLQVAKTILSQIGGNRVVAMIGAHSFTGTENALTFKFKARASNSSNCIRITLTPDDLYKVEFISLRGKSVKTKGEFDSIYAEDLKHLIEKETRLYLSL